MPWVKFMDKKTSYIFKGIRLPGLAQTVSGAKGEVG